MVVFALLNFFFEKKLFLVINTNFMIQKIQVPSIVLGTLLLLLVSCGKDDPQNPDPVSTGTVIARKTIGPEGGTLEGGNLVVTIPAQMISTPVELTLSKLKADAFGSQAAGDIVFINNLPSTAYGTLTLSMELSDSKSTLLVSETPWTPSNKGENLSFHAVEYTLNGKQAMMNLSLGGYKAGADASGEVENFSLGLLAVSGYTTTLSSGGHFRISYPVIYDEEAGKLADFLEEAFNVFTQAPYSLSVAKRTRWPVEVTICKLSSSVYGYFEGSVLGDNYASLLFNQDKLNDNVNLRATATHELMHLIQSLYDPRNRFSKAKLEAPTWWLDEAVAVWSEELTAAGGASYFISAARKGNEYLPYAGNFGLRPDDPQNFGYGMSAMIRYLVMYQGPSSIKNIYEKIAKGSKPADAIREGLGKFYWEWYGQFITQYTAGSIYSDLTVNVILGGKPETISFSSANDTVKTISGAYNPLQTKLFKVDLKAEALDEYTALSVSSVNPGWEYFAIFKYTTSAMEKIAEGSAPSVPQLKELITNGYKILVMAVNTQYESTSNQSRTIDFRVRLTNAPTYKSLFLIWV